MNKYSRKLIPVKNFTGIYRIHNVADVERKQFKDTGKFLSTRWISVSGKSKRESGVFSNFQDARDYHFGKEPGAEASAMPEVNAGDGSATSQAEKKMNFSELVVQWKEFHFHRLRLPTRKLYERKLPFLDFLNDRIVDEITPATVDELVLHWIKKTPKAKWRQSFEKELNLLTVILNFYRTRKNRNYPTPVFKDHYEASTLVKKAKGIVRAMEGEDLIRFLDGLSEQKNPLYHPLGLVQFGLTLRIGEACGLRPQDVDIPSRRVTISQVIQWDDRTWEATIKPFPKNEHQRTLGMPEFLVPVFEKLLAEHDPKISPLLFHKRGRPFNRKSIATMYNRVLEKLGIHYVSGTHMVRASGATAANDESGDFFAVSKQLGHSSVEVTKRYVKALDSQKRKVAAALDTSLAKTRNAQMEKRAERDRAVQTLEEGGTHSQKFTGKGRPKLFLVKTAS